jgi:hypothetical protein
MDWCSKSDPMCVLYEEGAGGEWIERARTEAIKVTVAERAFANSPLCTTESWGEQRKVGLGFRASEAVPPSSGVVIEPGRGRGTWPTASVCLLTAGVVACRTSATPFSPQLSRWNTTLSKSRWERGSEAEKEQECVSIMCACLHVVIACGVRMHIDFPPGMVHRKSASTFWMSTTPRRTLARLT